MRADLHIKKNTLKHAFHLQLLKETDLSPKFLRLNPNSQFAAFPTHDTGYKVSSSWKEKSEESSG